MPTYSYECFACGHKFEATQKITEDAISVCPECHKEEVKRIITASNFHLKGSGWYKTDYASGSSSSSSSSKSSSTSAVSSSDSGSSSSSSSSATASSGSCCGGKCSSH
ncbi:MAG: zinc ribbon domain-containing protein [bacterium]|nr:zinc ribbon domain-containing protein [bacterium]